MEAKKPLPWLKNGRDLCLASASPRRLELLQQVGLAPFVFPVQIDESVSGNESPLDYVQRMAQTKARAGAASGYGWVLAADTVVVIDGRPLGKPTDEAEAAEMLACLSGRQHQVMTAIALLGPTTDVSHSEVVVTDVWFKKITVDEIEAYVATKEPMDKAGSYGIQGVGAFMVEKIEGSYTAVVGLPLCETLALLTNYN
ncbi:MAG: septum formation inhibitor Maf [Magnetococcales bacterium]|nr:septum formation inhibitor Maf [Magnetococcales bacterium]